MGIHEKEQRGKETLIRAYYKNINDPKTDLEENYMI